jgi:hypothetical protein
VLAATAWRCEHLLPAIKITSCSVPLSHTGIVHTVAVASTAKKTFF